MTWYDRAMVKESFMPDATFWIDDGGNVIRCGRRTHGEVVMQVIMGRYGITSDTDMEEMDRADFPGMTDMEWKVLDDGEMWEEYDLAIKEWNWIRVNGNQVEMWDLTRRDMSRLAEGLERVYGMAAHKMEYLIDVMKLKRAVTMSYWDLDIGEIPAYGRRN